MVIIFKVIKLVGLVLFIVLLGACTDSSENAEAEIKQISQDLILINDDLELELEEKQKALEADKIGPLTFKAFLKDEVIVQTEDKATYLNTYQAPKTKTANRYFEIVHPWISVSNDILHTYAEMQILAIDNQLTEAKEKKYNDKLDELGATYNEGLEKMEGIEQELNEELDLSFN